MKPCCTARRFAAIVRGSFDAAELSVICARKPMSSTSISSGQRVKLLSLEERILARLGNSSSPISIKMIALNYGMAARDFSPFRACNMIASFYD